MVDNTERWGRKTARARYGKLGSDDGRAGLLDMNNPIDRSRPQKLGDRNNLQDYGYNNDHANDWVRGGGKDGAEGKPSFDKGPVHGKRA